MRKESFDQILDQCIYDISTADSWDELEEPTKKIQFLIKSEDSQRLKSLAETYERSLKHLMETIDVRPVKSFFIAPILFNKCSYTISYRSFWIRFREVSLAINNETEPRKTLLHIVLATVINAMLTNQMVALSYMVDILLAKPTKKWAYNEEALKHYGELFSSTGWFEENYLVLKEQVSGKWKNYNFTGTSGQITRWLLITSLLGFTESRSASVSWVTFLFNTIIANLLDTSLQTEQFNLALIIEKQAYSCYVNCVETSEFYENSYVKKIAPYFLVAGRKLRTGLKLPTIIYPETNQKPPKVCFLLYSSVFLAHTRNLFNYLKGFSQLTSKPIQPILIIAFDSPSHEILTLARECGVAVLHFSRVDLKPFDRLLRIRQWGVENEIAALVNTCIPITMPFAFSMRIAPVQIYWSMKYHSIEFDEIDGYLTTGSFEKYRTIDGKKWRVGHAAFNSLYKSEFKGNAEIKRRELTNDKNCVIFGCLGREAKINNDEYAEAVAQILTQVPNSIYIWTGRINHPEISSRFRKLGILDRCQFIGWVNTALYSQVLDVFLDSFPFASGHTAFESMAAGCPVVVRITPESLESSSLTHILPAFRSSQVPKNIQEDIRHTWLDEYGNMLLPIVEDFDSYVNTAVQLAVDGDFRHCIGELSRMFVNRFMMDTKLMTETCTNHILDIIKQSRDKLDGC